MASATTPSRKERERLRRRQEILSAALRLFAEKGFHNVSMQEIAAQAEFATGTLYNFFASKDDLFFEILAASAEDALDLVLSELDDPGDERQKLSRFIHSHERFVREHRDALQLYLHESRGRYLPGPRVEAKKREIDERVISRLSEVIAAGIARGILNEVDPVVAAKCLSAILESMILAGPPAAALKADLKKVEVVFFKGLVKSARGKHDA